MSYDDGSSSRVRSCSSLSYGRYEGVPGILIGTLGGEEEEQKKNNQNLEKIIDSFYNDVTVDSLLSVGGLIRNSYKIR